ncbi:MAG: hypothetical protein ACOYMZ_01240 [Minisyncoccia bacterium]
MNTPSLPSKQFLIRGGIATGIVVIILVVQTNWFQGLFNRKGTLSVTDITIGDLVAQDSNQNGIPDWEEKLWGLDPTELYTGDMSNREIIDNKKRALGLTVQEDAELNETDRLARELFSITAAIGNSGQSSTEALSTTAAQLGASVDRKDIIDPYTLRSIKTIPTSRQSLVTYKNTAEKILDTYSVEQADFRVVVEGLETGDFTRLPELEATAVSYKQLAKEMAGISAPIGVAQHHLDIVNSFAGIANSFIYLKEMDSNSIEGFKGIALYKNNALRLESAAEDLNLYLTEYGILQP